MLADLARIRELQLLQRTALVDADGGLLDEIDAERRAIHARLMPLSQAGLSPTDDQTARTLIDEISRGQTSLVAVAEEIRRQVGTELNGLHSGRGALNAYRMRGGDESRYLDGAR